MNAPSPVTEPAFATGAAALLVLLDASVVFAAVRALSARAERRTLGPLPVVAFALLHCVNAGVLLFVRCRPSTLLLVAGLVLATAPVLPSSAVVPLSSALRDRESAGAVRFGAYLLSVATIAALAYVHLPIATFLTSPGELGLHLEFLTTSNTRDMVIVVLLAALLYGLAVSPRMKTIMTCLTVGAVPVALAYSFALPFGYPMMSGLLFERLPISTTEIAVRAVLDAAVVTGGLALGLHLLVRFGGRRIVAALILLQASLLVTSALRVVRDPFAGAMAEEAQESRGEDLLRYSPGEPNVLILVLDRFMGSFVESILEDEPHLATRLDGFTWYPRSLAAGQNSIAGIHALLAGYDYTVPEMNGRNRLLRDLSTEAYSLLPINFTRAGWRVNMINPRGLGFTAAGDCSLLEVEGLRCDHVPSSPILQRARELDFPLTALSRSQFADLLSLLGAMRASPYSVKEILKRKGWTPFLDHSAGTSFAHWAQLDALPEVSSIEGGQPTLNLLWNLLPHEPYFLDLDCRPRTEMLELPSEVAEREGHMSDFSFQHELAARCSLLLVADYLDWMKDVGVYDDTTIVLVSDHGVVGPVSDRSSRAVAGGTQENVFARFRSLLLVKQRNERGELRVSEEFVPNPEVPRIVCREIGGCVNPFLDDRPVQALGRDRPFVVSAVEWQFQKQKPRKFSVIQHLAVTDGDPFDSGQWREAREP